VEEKEKVQVEDIQLVLGEKPPKVIELETIKEQNL
jgi:flagellar biogenesis protein FliO